MITTNSHVLLVCSVALALAVALLPAEAETQKNLKKLAQGTASWYGKKFHGRKTASGAIYDMNKLTCAHRTLPFGTKLLVYNESTSKSCVVTVNDRGPFHGRRVLDLSKAAAHKLGITGLGKVVCYQGDYLPDRDIGNADAALQTITALPNLETTTLSNMKPHALSEERLRQLSENLTSLAASNVSNTECLEKIARVPSGSGRITEDGLKNLESLPKSDRNSIRDSSESQSP